MAENEFRTKKTTISPPKFSSGATKGVFSGAGKIEQLFEAGVPIQYMPKIVFISGILILYIMNSYLIEKKRIKIERIKSDIEDLRTDYTTMKAEYMFKSKQSEVAKRVIKIGLKENTTPPVKIKIE